MAATTKTNERIPQEKKPVESELLNRQDFLWTKQDEPHLRRKYEILQKHPEIKELFGFDPATKWQCIANVLIQLIVCYLVKDASWWIFLPVAYVIGGSINHSCSVALHEITHGLCFDKLEYNYYFAMFTNLPLGIPSAMTFKRYHTDHHLYQGVPGYDTDVPTALEGKYIRTPLAKALHIAFMSLFYGVKPLIVAPKPPCMWEIIGAVFQLTFNAIIVFFWGWNAMLYFILCTFLGLGLHPLSGHFLSEHWVTHQGQETYSYYGPANWFMFNVGYHNEHHDFPRIPAPKLPLLRKIAPEYYETLAYVESWTSVILNYIFTDGYTCFCRQVRSIEDHKKARKEYQSRGYKEHACDNETWEGEKVKSD
ncbi:hypothetical protein ABK040_013284 [Willaertia magna]